MHIELVAEQAVFAAVHLFPAQHMPKSPPQVMQLFDRQTVSVVIGPGASH